MNRFRTLHNSQEALRNRHAPPLPVFSETIQHRNQHQLKGMSNLLGQARLRHLESEQTPRLRTALYSRPQTHSGCNRPREPDARVKSGCTSRPSELRLSTTGLRRQAKLHVTTNLSED